MRGFFGNTLAELKDRKVIYIYLVVTLVMVLVVLMSGQLRIQAEGIVDPEMDLSDVNDMLGNPYLTILNGFIGFLIFLTVMSCSPILPGKLIKGRADFYLSKPLSRPTFLLNELISIFLVYSLLVTLCSLVVVGTAAMVYDLFETGFFILLLFNLINYMIYLTILFFCGVVFGTTVISILTVFIVWVAQSLLMYHESISDFINSKVLTSSVTTLYYIFPKQDQIDNIAINLATDKAVSSYMPLYSSLLFSLVLIILMIYIFKRKNY